MRDINLETSLKAVSIMGIILISFSICYYFVYRPIKLDSAYKKCFNQMLVETGDDGIAANEKNKIHLDVCSKLSK